MNICITQYSDTAHRAGVIALWDAVFGHKGAHNKPSLAINKKLEVADGLFFVAILDQKVIGSVMAGYDGHRGWIYSVAVSPEHRRKGTGSQLIRFAERALANKGCMKVNLQIMEGNESVTAFYKKLGFAVEKRISMGKPLNQNIPPAENEFRG